MTRACTTSPGLQLLYISTCSFSNSLTSSLRSSPVHGSRSGRPPTQSISRLAIRGFRRKTRHVTTSPTAGSGAAEEAAAEAKAEAMLTVGGAVRLSTCARPASEA
eukprot:scaffold234692_cov32-Tisochrysis_lutea.AAC.2